MVPEPQEQTWGHGGYARIGKVMSTIRPEAARQRLKDWTGADIMLIEPFLLCDPS
ncbi:hypothetical protein GCM10027361_29030 [Erwinia aphidicola]